MRQGRFLEWPANSGGIRLWERCGWALPQRPGSGRAGQKKIGLKRCLLRFCATQKRQKLKQSMRYTRFVWAVTGAAIFSCHMFAAELAERPPNPPQIAGPSDEAEIAIRNFTIPPGFKVELFAAEPLLAHPVAFAVDEQNRFFISESFRVGEQVTDIRRQMHWLDEELASTNTVQFRHLIEKYYADKLDFMRAETERITLLEDTTGDGKADRSVPFASGFNDLTSGIASGILARQGDVYFTCIPDLWLMRDSTGDGVADQREVLHHGYGVRFGFYGHDLHGLRLGPDGKLYFTIGDRGFNVVTSEGTRVAAPEEGAVLRCNLDGSELEIFATGLRNPQELAFDDYGNLFTGDNNSDGGDQARWVYLVEGADSGWRIGWQFLNWPVPRGPFNAEKMWHPQNEAQPAYIVPPVANLADGPSGLTFYPGTGLPAEFDRHFFLADFRGTPSQSLVHTFALEPKGASFEVVNRRPFISGILVTDVDFGMDGAIYISDWVEGWGKTGKGRLYRMHHPESRGDARVEQTRELMARGFADRTPKELQELLAWPDQRVRQEAQFELAARGRSSVRAFSDTARKSPHQLARLHAIWGLGQIHGQLRKSSARSAAAALKPVAALLKDSDPEVRAQAAKVVGEARFAPARADLARLTTDFRTPRVQFFAAMALGKIGDPRGIKPVIEMLRQNGDQDAYLRHAGVMALTFINDIKSVHTAARDSSPAVRMAALLTLRRMESPGLSQFLQDPEPRLVLEAARAIYDLPIERSMPDLATLIHESIHADPLLRRVVNANFRVGSAGSAQALARLAASGAALESGRVEALISLGDWEKPSGRDRVTGLWRPLGERDGQVAANALRPVLPELLGGSAAAVQVEAARLAGKFQINEAAPALEELAHSESAAVKARIAAIRALADLNAPALPKVIEMAGASSHEELRKTASAFLARLNPETATGLLAGILDSGTVGEKQAALAALGEIESQGAEELLAHTLEKLLHGELDPALHLELIEAAGRRSAPRIASKLEQFEGSRPSTETGKFVETLFGGNPEEGRKIFFERAEASCARCHKVGGEGGDAGPPLDRAGLNRAREHLLESIVDPNRSITPGFETLVVTLKNGIVYTGIAASETADELVIISPEDGEVSVVKAEIESRGRGLSGMPEGLGEVLSQRDLRDLIAYLAALE
jgi:quinoprotein glucose dehydrogenase